PHGSVREPFRSGRSHRCPARSRRQTSGPDRRLSLRRCASPARTGRQWPMAARRLPGPTLLRATAFERFAAAGLPSRRIEEWKYTDLRALMREAKPLADAPDAGAVARARQAEGILAAVDAR